MQILGSWRAGLGVALALLGLGVGLRSVGAQVDVIGRPKSMAAKPASPVGKPIAMQHFLTVKLLPPNQAGLIGAPVSYTVQVTQTGAAQPVTLVPQHNTGRQVTLTPATLPAAASGTATLTLSPSPGQQEEPGSYGVQVKAEAGTASATGIATLSLGDPECGNGPPVLTLTLGTVRWSFKQASGQPGAAEVPITIKNSGGRLPNPVTLRIFRVGSDCLNGVCINGPLLPSGQIGALEVPVRGGCARTLYDRPVKAQSTFSPSYCQPGATGKSVTAQVQVVGAPELQGGAPAPIACANLMR